MTSSLITINLNVFLETARSKFLTSKDSFFPKTECQGLHLMCRPQCWLKGYDLLQANCQHYAQDFWNFAVRGRIFGVPRHILGFSRWRSWNHIGDTCMTWSRKLSSSDLFQFYYVGFVYTDIQKFAILSCHNLARRWGELRQFTA